MKKNSVIAIAKGIVIFILAWTFLYQYLKIDANLVMVTEYRSDVEQIADVRTRYNNSLAFSNHMAEIIMNGRDILVLQVVLFILYLVFDLWRFKTVK